MAPNSASGWTAIKSSRVLFTASAVKTSVASLKSVPTRIRGLRIRDGAQPIRLETLSE